MLENLVSALRVWKLTPVQGIWDEYVMDHSIFVLHFIFLCAYFGVPISVCFAEETLDDYFAFLHLITESLFFFVMLYEQKLSIAIM